MTSICYFWKNLWCRWIIILLDAGCCRQCVPGLNWLTTVSFTNKFFQGIIRPKSWFLRVVTILFGVLTNLLLFHLTILVDSWIGFVSLSVIGMTHPKNRTIAYRRVLIYILDKTIFKIRGLLLSVDLWQDYILAFIKIAENVLEAQTPRVRHLVMCEYSILSKIFLYVFQTNYSTNIPI